MASGDGDSARTYDLARRRAGRELARRWPIGELTDSTLVVRVAGGGIPVAEGMWLELGTRPRQQLDGATARIFHPADPSLAIGAVTGGELWLHPEIRSFAPVAETDYRTVSTAVEELKRTQSSWPSLLGAVAVKPQRIVVVEDVIATGTSTLSIHNALTSYFGQTPVFAFSPFMHVTGAACLAENNIELAYLEMVDQASAISASTLFKKWMD